MLMVTLKYWRYATVVRSNCIACGVAMRVTMLLTYRSPLPPMIDTRIKPTGMPFGHARHSAWKRYHPGTHCVHPGPPLPPMHVVPLFGIPSVESMQRSGKGHTCGTHPVSGVAKVPATFAHQHWTCVRYGTAPQP